MTRLLTQTYFLQEGAAEGPLVLRDGADGGHAAVLAGVPHRADGGGPHEWRGRTGRPGGAAVGLRKAAPQLPEELGGKLGDALR